ncbi:MAG: LemA family protein [archaeon]|jgi:LemA protein
MDLTFLVTVLIGIIIVLFIIIIVIYNGLISMRNAVKNSWHGIDIQLKRRKDLIPNLVETVKGYSKYEKNLLEEITKIRTALINSDQNVKKSAAADELLSQNLKSLFAVAENYPKLKANENFLKLQYELTNTEDEISAARRIYNNNVRDYNIAIESFPKNILASIFGFLKEDYFTATKEERENVKADFQNLN